VKSPIYAHVNGSDRVENGRDNTADAATVAATAGAGKE
jgi:hypothetical protein